MKKIIALTLIAVIGIFAMVGCAKSGSGEDPIELALKLEERGYYVQLVVDHDEIMEEGSYLEVDFAGVEAIISVSGSKSTVTSGIFFFCDDEDVAEYIESKMVELSVSNDIMESLRKGAVDRNGTIVFIGSQEFLSFIE